ncbi:interferon-stimulated gene 20 kDa protein [Aplochiton taeniatus]
MLTKFENVKARRKWINLRRKKIERNAKLETKVFKKSKTEHILQETSATSNPEELRTQLAPFGQHRLDTPVDNSQTCDTKIETGPEIWITTSQKLSFAPRKGWEVDSGFSSEASPPASGRSSPCTLATVVAMDCEMVGTGPGGCCSELARCSILDYDGLVLYDKYVRPCQPVTDYRTRWSGIQKHHLKNAVPFAEAQKEITGILEGKVLVGHALHNDLKVLGFPHPRHMVRDTMGMPLLGRRAGFPKNRGVSLKVLACKLLNRQIQVGRKGHCSVEDALAAMDLYKLVQVDWEQDLQERGRTRATVSDPATSGCYMQDKYWPEKLAEASQ